MISPTPRRGTGMLAVFCDLEPQWHREFREWLVDDMFAARLKIGFTRCASYDRIAGNTQPFVTIYETASLGDLYDTPYQRLRANRDARDKGFHARFLVPDRYTLNWVGPELDRGGESGFAPVAVFDRIDLEVDAVQDFNGWFVSTYLPGCAGIAGLLRVRRYLAMEGSPAHVMVHEFADETPLAGELWLGLRRDLQSRLPAFARLRSGSYRRAVSAGA